MKFTIKLLILFLLMFSSFVSGILWEYSAERQEIADIEQVALESCNIRVKNIQKLCK